MKLIPIPQHPDSASLLYTLLSEQAPEQSISHKEMPLLEAHEEFIRTKPYTAWYLADVDGHIVGSTYLGKEDNIGIRIFKDAQRRGFGPEAVRLLMDTHPREVFWANINPKNAASIWMFERKLGFKFDREEPTQVVYRWAA